MIISDLKGQSPEIDEKVSSSNADKRPGPLIDKLESTDNTIDISVNPLTKKIDLKASANISKNYAYLVDASPGGGN